MAMQNEDYDFPPEATEDVLLDEPPAITSVKTNAPSPSERNKYSTPSALGNKAAKRSPEKMLPPSRHLKHIKTTSGSKKPETRFEKSVDKLYDIGKLAAENEDQFDKYGKYIASQLREMPLRSFISLQSKINTLITTERLLCLDTEQGQSSTQRSQSPYSSGSSCSTPANLHSQISPYSGSSSSTPADLHSQMSPYSHISSDQTQGLYDQDEIGGLDILSQAMVGMCDAGTHHADLTLNN
ncbi:hypothetical protein J6590_102204 [Homalodisca vitripennis]|nr:hypothetical protein J6590_102204 [Homalodisca vitripennis]